jgi:pimeloyl-ACP methyl ester carboxylesterase
VHLLPDGELRTVDAGHLVHATQPSLFLDAVTAFLDA